MSHKAGFPNYYAAAGDVYDVKDAESMFDLSCQGLTFIPEIVNSHSICALYLQDNCIDMIPDDFFPSLPSLMWLDLRNNNITTIPKSIKLHPCLSHLLLQNNKIQSLPNEIGSLPNLKVLRITGNPLEYPAKEVLDLGERRIMGYLKEMHEYETSNGEASESTNSVICRRAESAESLLVPKRQEKSLRVKVSDRERLRHFEKMFPKREGKCPRLASSRSVLPHYSQSMKYTPPPRVGSKEEQSLRLRRSALREMAQRKTREILERREKILQDRRNLALLDDWRSKYRQGKSVRPKFYEFDPKNVPYDTSADHMILLSREDLERDLPDKYRKRLYRKSAGSAPRRTNGDRELAEKIKQMFLNLEKLDLNKEGMTPRTEQSMLLKEINKISEIKRKLSEMTFMTFKNTVD